MTVFPVGSVVPRLRPWRTHARHGEGGKGLGVGGVHVRANVPVNVSPRTSSSTTGETRIAGAAAGWTIAPSGPKRTRRDGGSPHEPDDRRA